MPDVKVEDIVPEKWPLFKNKAWGDTIFKFMQSYNNHLSPNINMTSMMFMVGPPKTGKSWMLQQALTRFKNTSLPKIIVEYDIPAIASFEVVLYSIEQGIIDAIVNAQERGDISLSTDELLSVVFKFYEKGLFELQLDSLELEGMKYDEDRVFRETPLLDEFDERTKAIAEKKNVS